MVKLQSGHTIIRRFVRYDKGEHHNEIVVERLKPEPQKLAINMDLVEDAHRIVGVGDPRDEP